MTEFSVVMAIALAISTSVLGYLLLAARKSLAGRETELQVARKELELMTQRIEQMEEQKRENLESVKLIAKEVMFEQTKEMQSESRKSVEQLLNPLKENIAEFSRQVREAYGDESKERRSLKAEIEMMFKHQKELAEEANHLATALKGDRKAQGNLGELRLELLLERAGLREGEEFVREAKDMALTGVDGKRQRPDVLVKLPDGKHIIVDAKMSLNSYTEYYNAENDTDRDAALKVFERSLKAHIDGLDGKAYDALSELGAPDFILMFCPIPGAYLLALEKLQDVFEYGWQKNIMLVGPGNLISSLKTIGSLWRLAHQNRNAEKIADVGGKLFDKFVAFTEDMRKIGGSIDQAQKHYSSAIGKLTDGRGNLVGIAEKLNKMGVKTRKELHSSLRSGDDEAEDEVVSIEAAAEDRKYGS